MPNLLYILTRYGSLAAAGFEVGLGFSPPGRTCNVLANVGNAMSIFTFIGVQGILIARAYTLCNASRTITGLLALGFLSGLVTNLTGVIKFNGCITNNYGGGKALLSLLASISIIVTDALIFGVCLWEVWGTWRLKRQTGIRGNSDIVSLLLRQIVSRFCFVLTITLAAAILNQVFETVPVLDILLSFQDSLSAILISNFTLDLRRRNSPLMPMGASNVSLSLQYRDALQHIHQSVLIEMGDHENIAQETDPDSADE